MATDQVPGYDPANRDKLAMGCWAEAEDGSLLLVEGVEANRVVYSLFDLSQDPPLEYRDSLGEWDFKRAYSWVKNADPVEVLAEKPKRARKNVEAAPADDDPAAKIQTAKVHWTWHDKTPFPWDRVMKAGARPGMRYASAEGQISAARKVAEMLGLKAQDLGKRRFAQYGEDAPKKVKKAMKLARRLERALAAMPGA